MTLSSVETVYAYFLRTLKHLLYKIYLIAWFNYKKVDSILNKR